MKKSCVLVTGSSGLIGSEAVGFFDSRGWKVVGVDNNLRRFFFGPSGDTTWNLKWLVKNTTSFEHLDLDIRNREAVLRLFREKHFDLIVHCAAQPSHDLAAKMPFEDWDVNAGGTVNLLEAARRFARDSPFVHVSTNKVYGDAPNEIDLVELETRYDYARDEDLDGIDETCRIDRCLHSLFGASKTAGDVMAQEYGRYFEMPIGIFRGGCLTGSHHSGVELHGFLSYLGKATVHQFPYKIFGYKGKQVRDNIHSNDVLNLFYQFYKHPRCGEVYNLGGGRANSVSVLEAIKKFEGASGKRLKYSYDDTNRIGDHICYISNLGKIMEHFPKWEIGHSIDDIVDEIVRFEARSLEERS